MKFFYFRKNTIYVYMKEMQSTAVEDFPYAIVIVKGNVVYEQ